MSFIGLDAQKDRWILLLCVNPSVSRDGSYKVGSRTAEAVVAGYWGSGHALCLLLSCYLLTSQSLLNLSTAMFLKVTKLGVVGRETRDGREITSLGNSKVLIFFEFSLPSF